MSKEELEMVIDKIHDQMGYLMGAIKCGSKIGIRTHQKAINRLIDEIRQGLNA